MTVITVVVLTSPFSVKVFLTLWDNSFVVVMLMLLEEALICLYCYVENLHGQKTVNVPVHLYNAVNHIYMLILRIFVVKQS
jgi:hypothetical protein